MGKKPLNGVSILVVVLFVLGSLSNVVGYLSVQTSQQNVINERINQRELLFQTIVDIANNKEIQRIILKSQMSRAIFPTSEVPKVTKNQIRQMYFIGLILSKFISKSKIQSIVWKYQLKYQLQNLNTQKEMNCVIEKDVTLKNEITQLQNSDCNCEKNIDEKICGLLFIIMVVTSAPILGPFKVIIEFLRNMELILLEKIFFLISLPILLPFLLIFTISFFLFFIVFLCSPISLIEQYGN